MNETARRSPGTTSRIRSPVGNGGLASFEAWLERASSEVPPLGWWRFRRAGAPAIACIVEYHKEQNVLYREHPSRGVADDDDLHEVANSAVPRGKKMLKAIYETRDWIAYITMNRPEVRNAIDEEVDSLLWRSFEHFATTRQLTSRS
jgi:hypothetical protein